jgi:hypothetical protein
MANEQRIARLKRLAAIMRRSKAPNAPEHVRKLELGAKMLAATTRQMPDPMAEDRPSFQTPSEMSVVPTSDEPTTRVIKKAETVENQ